MIQRKFKGKLCMELKKFDRRSTMPVLILGRLSPPCNATPYALALEFSVLDTKKH